MVKDWLSHWVQRGPEEAVWEGPGEGPSQKSQRGL